MKKKKWILSIAMGVSLLLVLLVVSLNLTHRTIFGDHEGTPVTVTTIQSLEAALMAFKIDTGEFPSTSEGLTALIETPKEKEEKWKGPYLTKLPPDPWGNPYQYEHPGTKNKYGNKGYDMWSLGPDGVTSEDDTTNWDN